MSTLDNFRAVGAAAARLVADLLDGPEPCGHDYDRVVDDLGPFEHYCESFTDEESSRAEGTQRAQTPGEVSGDQSPDPSPSPGDYPHPSAAELADLPDVALLNEFSAALLKAGRRARLLVDQLHLFNLADAARDRACQFAAAEAEPFVSREDLAAHIEAVRNWYNARIRDGKTCAAFADEIASDLLADYFITPK